MTGPRAETVPEMVARLDERWMNLIQGENGVLKRLESVERTVQETNAFLKSNFEQPLLVDHKQIMQPSTETLRRKMSRPRKALFSAWTSGMRT